MSHSTQELSLSLLLRLANTLVTPLLRLGAPMGPQVLLTVRGRKTGLARTTPVAVVELLGQRWLIAPLGETDWVRNLRAANGRATLSRGMYSEEIDAVEVPTFEAARVLHALRQRRSPLVTALTGRYSRGTPDSPMDVFEEDAANHPVFRIQPALL